jgi:hypothetical protein
MTFLDSTAPRFREVSCTRWSKRATLLRVMCHRS